MLEFAQQREDLRLYRHIQRGRGFVGDEQLRTSQQRHGDHHPLAFAAGKLVRVVGQTPQRIADPNAIQTVEDLSARRFFTHPAMQREHFVELFFEGMQRIE